MGNRVVALIEAGNVGRAKVWHCTRERLKRAGPASGRLDPPAFRVRSRSPRHSAGASRRRFRVFPSVRDARRERRPRRMRSRPAARCPRLRLEKTALRGIPFAPNCAIVAADGAVLPVTGRSASECSALCRASTHRKENYGYCQESYKEAGREKARREEIRREETRREEIRREESTGEKTRREEAPRRNPPRSANRTPRS